MKKLFVIGLLAIALALGACSDDKKSDTTTSGSNSSKSSSPSSASSFDAVTAKQQITTAFQTFFDGQNPDSQAKLNQLENPALAKGLYDSTLGDPKNQAYASQTSATISDIQFTDDTHAQVTFTLNLSGNPTLQNQIGSAVYKDGAWKITLVTFCDISALGNPAANDDPACADSGSSDSGASASS